MRPVEAMLVAVDVAGLVVALTRLRRRRWTGWLSAIPVAVAFGHILGEGYMRLERRRSGGWSEHDIATTLGAMRATFGKLTGGGYYVEIPNLFHVNFTDLPYWLSPSAQLGLSGPIGGRRGFATINAYTVAFFDQALRRAASPLLGDAPRPISGTTVTARPPARGRP